MAISKVIYKSSPNATPETWMDATTATAAAEDIIAPKTAMLADGVMTTGTGTGGGGVVEVPEKDVNFVDYDGTILYSYTASEFNNLSALPSNPTHTGLTSQGWNWTLSDAKTQVTACGKCTIGQNYITTSGKTEIDIELQEGRLSPYLGIGVNGSVTIDWGDSSATSTVTGTSLSTVKNTQHIYETAGSYTIELSVNSGSFAIIGTSNAKQSCLFWKQVDVSSSRVNSPYLYAVQNVRLGENVSLGSYALTECSGLKTITIPTAITAFGDRCFHYCNNLQFVVVPSGTSTIPEYCFAVTHTMLGVSFPKSITSIGSSAISTCNTHRAIVLPDGITTAGTYAVSSNKVTPAINIPSSITAIPNSFFSGSYGLIKVSVPSGVTSIGTNAFSNASSVIEYHLYPTSPPTLSGTNAFTGIASDCVIYVPRSANQTVLNSYKTATNWSTYASYMQEEPQ